MQTLNKTISHYQQGSEFSATDRAVNFCTTNRAVNLALP